MRIRGERESHLLRIKLYTDNTNRELLLVVDPNIGRGLIQALSDEKSWLASTMRLFASLFFFLCLSLSLSLSLSLKNAEILEKMLITTGERTAAHLLANLVSSACSLPNTKLQVKQHWQVVRDDIRVRL